MKKVLLAGTAILGLAALASPAQAEVKLDLGGFFRGYAMFTDNDEPAGAANSLREFDFRRHTEIHFSGETTTDNGLTIGVHNEIELGGAEDTNEAYMYASGGWGRVNFGSEDGAAYLLQVSAPSADSNVDGMRVYMQGLNTNLWDGGNFDAGSVLGYDHADFRDTDRLTYMTPKWNGFQAGVSYAPESGQNAIGNHVGAMATDEDPGEFENLWELAARWDGEYEGFGISFGAGYSDAGTEDDLAAGIGVVGSDDLQTWNVGLNVAFDAFNVGAAYHTTDNGIGGSAIACNNAGIVPASCDGDTDTWVVGAGWDNGPYHVGASWLNSETEEDAFAAADTSEIEVDRFTVGGGYTYGPGMTFRGAVAFGSADAGAVGVDDNDFTQVTIGTDVQF